MAPKKTLISLAAKRQQRKRPGSIELVPPLKNPFQLADRVFIVAIWLFVSVVAGCLGYSYRSSEIKELKQQLAICHDAYNGCNEQLQQKQTWKQQRGCLQSKEWAQL